LGDPAIAFDGLAAALGAASYRVEAPDVLEEVVQQAVQEPGPSLVEVVIDGRFP
jgi:thiamine pyrophosphate-dependent acetolactate synthase large subunit-like protein